MPDVLRHFKLKYCFKLALYRISATLSRMVSKIDVEWKGGRAGKVLSSISFNTPTAGRPKWPCIGTGASGHVESRMVPSSYAEVHIS